MLIDIIGQMGDRVIAYKKQSWGARKLVGLENEWNFIKRQFMAGKADREILVDFISKLKPMTINEYIRFMELSIHHGCFLSSYKKLPDGYLKHKKELLLPYKKA